MIKMNNERLSTIIISLVLAYVFLLLKTIGMISWGWFWITSPLWIEFIIFPIFGYIFWKMFLT